MIGQFDVKRLRSNLAGFLTNSILLNKIHYCWEVPTTLRVFITDDVTGVNLKFLRKKWSDRNVSTVVLCVFLLGIFHFILLTSNSMVSRAILK